MEALRLITFFKMDDGRVDPSSLNDFEELVTMNYYEKVPERGQFPWQQNLGARPHQLRSFEREVRIAIQHALWDVILVYRLLPFPLCAMRDQDGMVVPQSMADDRVPNRLLPSVVSGS